MHSELIIMPIFFGVIFGIIYLFFSTRNKERMALIEKGVGAEIFNKGKQSNSPGWKVFVLNFALLLTGIGVGIFVGGTMHEIYGLDAEIAFPGSIFTFAGLALVLGFYLTKKLDKE
ncbi:DUF6249 domain-containing protein [Urechidicola croceus]|uniref:DUF6249 domain-containing protein n=1 Tax=Urechidicola croceus TaxID=1850246 RepID=A0A1D8PB93_9FLAO|nr:DUF6249 domain-containing protein [Urechidicola croceus]AOW21852.1 hypothetical protein LPB138_14675 [Urechidicola croceus]